MSNDKHMKFAYLGTAVMSIACIIYVMTKDYACNNENRNVLITTDTVKNVQIVTRPVYISDTIKIKSVAWKTRDSIIFVKDSIPCGDTSFIAQSDSVLLPTGDTLNLAFNYLEKKGSFSVVYRPRPDSIITKIVNVPIHQETSGDLGYVFGAFGVGVLVGIGIILSGR